MNRQVATPRTSTRSLPPAPPHPPKGVCLAIELWGSQLDQHKQEANVLLHLSFVIEFSVFAAAVQSGKFLCRQTAGATLRPVLNVN